MIKVSKKIKGVFIVAGITLLIGIGLFAYHRYRVSFQNSIRYIDLAVLSMDDASSYPKVTDVVQLLSYIFFGVTGFLLVLGGFSLLKAQIKTRKKVEKVKKVRTKKVELPSSQNPRFCTQCGNLLEGKEQFCAKCGKRLE